MVKKEDYRVTTVMPVAWGDMDAFGVVNNTVYFRYFETARIEYYNKMNLDILSIDNTGIGPIMARTSCKYIQPLRFPDTITVGVRVREIGKYHLDFEMAVFSAHTGIAALGEAEIVMFDYLKGKKAPVPVALIEGIEKIEDGSFTFPTR